MTKTKKNQSFPSVFDSLSPHTAANYIEARDIGFYYYEDDDQSLSGPAPEEFTEPGLVTWALTTDVKGPGVTPFNHVAPFEWFVELYGEPRVTEDKTDNWLFSGCSYAGGVRRRVSDHWSTGRIARDKSALLCTSMITVDFDEPGNSFDRLCDEVSANALEAFIYTTHSHTPEHPRLRAVFPLKKPVTLDGRAEQQLWKRRYEAFAGRWGGTYDKSCSDPNRLSYLPAHAPDAEFSSHYFKTDQFVDWHSIPATSKPAKEYLPRPEYDSSDSDLREVRAALDYISPDCSRHEWLMVLFALQAQFDDDAFELARDWSARSATKFDDDDFERTWLSADPDGGITFGSFWHLAQQYGYERSRCVEALLPDPAVVRQIARRKG